MKRLSTIIVLCLLFSINLFSQEAVELLGQLNPHSNQGYTDIWGYTADGREYALLCTGGGTSIVEITDPSNPVEVDFISGPNSGWRDVKTHGSYAYIVTEGTGEGRGLQVVDLSSLPDSASLVNTVDEYFDSAHNIFIDEGYAYVIGTNAGGGMHILDLADPVNPVRTNYYLDSDYIHDVYVWSDTVVACAADSYDLVDVSDKSNPQLISSSPELPGIYAHSGWMTEDKRYFVAAEEGNERDILIWDLQDRSNWSLIVDKLKFSDDTPVHNIFINGDYAHISYYKEGYIVLDISDPSSPLIVGQYDTYPSNTSFFSGAWGCYPFLPSGNIIVSDMQTGLYVFSFTPVENPAPFLSHEILDSELATEEEVEVKVTIFDNGSITNAFLYYRTTFDNQASAWTSVEDIDGPEGDEYNFFVPGQEHLTEVEYYFAAKDDGGKVTTLPTGGSGEPAGSIPPSEFYSFTIINAGIPIITSVSPIFTDTTIAKGESIAFSASAMDTSSLDITYRWSVDGQVRASGPEFTFNTTLIFESRTDTVSLTVSNGYNEVTLDWIVVIDIASEVDDQVLLTYSLQQNYPNPFNPSTRIKYSIPEAANVKLNIYNSIGELVRTVVNKYQSPGSYEVEFDASKLSSGFYIARIITNKFKENIKMLLVK